MTTTMPTPAPVVAPVGRQDTCRICPLPFAEWDAYPGAVDCPPCVRDAIAEDHAHVRRADL